MKFRLILLSCALAVAAYAADVKGKWTYEMQGRGGQSMTGALNLKADGNTLTGTVSGRRGEPRFRTARSMATIDVQCGSRIQRKQGHHEIHRHRLRRQHQFQSGGRRFGPSRERTSS